MNEKKKFWQTTWFTWLMLVFIAPIGIILLWKNNMYSKRVKIPLTVLFAIFFLVVANTSDDSEMAEAEAEVAEEEVEVVENASTKEEEAKAVAEKAKEDEAKAKEVAAAEKAKAEKEKEVAVAEEAKAKKAKEDEAKAKVEKQKKVFTEEVEPEIQLLINRYDDAWATGFQETAAAVGEGTIDIYTAWGNVDDMIKELAGIKEEFEQFSEVDGLSEEQNEKMKKYSEYMSLAVHTRIGASNDFKDMLNDGDYSPASMNSVVEQIEKADGFMMIGLMEYVMLQEELMPSE